MGGEIVRIDISKGAKHTVSTDLFCTFVYMYVQLCVSVLVSLSACVFVQMNVHLSTSVVEMIYVCVCACIHVLVVLIQNYFV